MSHPLVRQQLISFVIKSEMKTAYENILAVIMVISSFVILYLKILIYNIIKFRGVF